MWGHVLKELGFSRAEAGFTGCGKTHCAREMTENLPSAAKASDQFYGYWWHG
jgi:hypothetical protein